MNALAHTFRDQLEWSASLEDEPGWIAFYRSIWPDMETAIRLDGRCEFQLRGVDRLIIRRNGQEHRIDEKKRAKDYGDLLLEVWDRVPFGEYDEKTRRLRSQPTKPGWAVDPTKMSDFIAYAIPTAGRVYLLPFEILRLTMGRCLPEWKKDPAMYPIVARNRDYLTVSVAVTWSRLRVEMAATMTAGFGDGAPLPGLVTADGQTVCNWPGRREEGE